MLSPPAGGGRRSSLTQPAARTVPVAFLAMVAGSLATRSRRTPYVHRLMARMHDSEAVGLDRADPGGG